jgi:hypothetical protein
MNGTQHDSNIQTKHILGSLKEIYMKVYPLLLGVPEFEELKTTSADMASLTYLSLGIKNCDKPPYTLCPIVFQFVIFIFSLYVQSINDSSYFSGSTARRKSVARVHMSRTSLSHGFPSLRLVI